MSEPSAGLTIWKPIMVFLLISLIGTVWLYEHYDDKLRDELRARTAQLAKANSQLSDQSAELASIKERGDDINDDMEALKQSHADEVAQLKKWLEQARQAGDNLGQQLERQKQLQEEALAAVKASHEEEMDRLRLAHTRALQTAQLQAADVEAAKAQTEDSCAELDRNYDAAKETIVRLETKLAGLNDAIAASAAEHREQVERLQQHINERIELARITPMDAELVRAAKQAGILDEEAAVTAAEADQPAESAATATAAASGPETASNDEQMETPCDMPGVKDALDKLEAEHNAVLAQHDAALKAQADDLADKHRSEIEDLERAHADEVAGLQEALDKAGNDLATAREQLVAAEKEATAKLAAAEQRLMAVQGDAKTDEQSEAGAAEIETLRQQLEAAQQAAKAAEEALAEHKAGTVGGADAAGQELATLTTDLEQARGELADVQAQCDARVEQLTSELAGVKSAAAAAQTAVSDARAEAEAAKKALSKARDEAAAAQAALAEARDKAEAEVAGQRQAAEQAEAAAAAAQAKAEQAVQACAEQTQDLRQALDAAKSEVGALEARIDETGTAAADAKAEADARIKALEVEVDKYQRAAEQARAAVQEDADASVAALRDLYSRFSALGGRYTERGMLLRLADTELRFPSGAATLPAGELPSLDKIAGLLADHPDLRVRIEGHTDSSGADELNRTLSRQRAEAVQAALVERGVAAERINAEGLGSSRPIGDNATVAGRGENRRVEVYVIEPEG